MLNVEKAYNNWSEIYDTNKNKTRDLELVVGKKLLAGKRFDNIIELGCGTGKNTEWLVDICESILGVDFSSEMLAQAKKKLTSNKVKFIKANLLKTWIFVKESADLVTFSLVLEHIENLEHIFSEAHKSLNENGLLYICELHPFKQYCGSKARFEMNNEIIELETYIHHISDYMKAEKKFKLIQFNEWFDNTEKTELPRLVSFIFKKV